MRGRASAAWWYIDQSGWADVALSDLRPWRRPSATKGLFFEYGRKRICLSGRGTQGDGEHSRRNPDESARDTIAAKMQVRQEEAGVSGSDAYRTHYSQLRTQNPQYRHHGGNSGSVTG